MKGASIIEILIAVAVLTLGMAAAILLSFANQDLKIDSETNSEALAKASALIENARATSRDDFNLVNPVATTTDDIYKKALDVRMVDFVTKKIISRIVWNEGSTRPQIIELSTLVANWQNPDNTCHSVISNPIGWKNPQIASYELGKDLLVPSDPSSGFPIGDVDVHDGKLYVVVNNSNGNNFPTFFTFDVSDPTVKPVFINSFDTDTSVKAGLSAVTVSGHYAYVAKGTGPSNGQLQIIDLNTNSVVVTYKVPGVTGTGGKALGNAIFYKDGYVYLGLTKTASGPEFNVIDVSTPTAPSWKAGYSVGNGVNSIYVKNGYVYIASPNAEDLIVTDVRPSAWPNLPHTGGFNGTGGLNGKSVSVIGSKIYLGRTFGTNEFYILNGAIPSSISEIAHKDLGSGNDTSINGLLIRDYLAFFVTNQKFQVWNIADTGNIYPWTENQDPNEFLDLPGNSTGTSLDCEGNYIYFGSLPSNDKGYVAIVGPKP